MSLHVISVTCHADCCIQESLFNALERRLKPWRTIDLRFVVDRGLSEQAFEVRAGDTLLFSGVDADRYPTPVEAAALILRHCGFPDDADSMK